MKLLPLLLSCIALPASAQVASIRVAPTPVLGAVSAAATINASAVVGLPSASALPLVPTFVATPVSAVVTPISAAASALPVSAKAALIAAAPTATRVVESASGESLTAQGRIVFDSAATRADGSLPVIAAAATRPASGLKKFAASAAALLAAPSMALAQSAESASPNGSPLTVALIFGAALLGLFLLLRWSKNNLRKITEEEIAEFTQTIEARKGEWMNIPGVKSLEIVPLTRMDDTPPAYLRIVVDHVGPDNKDLLPPHHEKWSPVIASMFPSSLREAARIGSLDGKGYWPIAVVIAR